MNKKVIYTAIFGGKDALHEPEYIPEGFDFVCFTDNPTLRSSTWDVCVVPPPLRDPVRSARYFKILSHRVLPEYTQSVWIDGNMIVKGDVGELVQKYLKHSSLCVYNHARQKRRVFKVFWIRDWSFARNCIYKEARDLIEKTKRGIYMDNPKLIQNQMNRYKNDGYPEESGLATTMVLLRNHNDTEVRNAMEKWWEEIEKGSRRDQLSFNYVMWKCKVSFTYIKGDPRYNKYFARVGHKIKENPKK